MIRCIECRTEFELASLEDAKACLRCGSTTVPADTDNDLALMGPSGGVAINWHELRILVQWARNWARYIQSKKERDPRANALATIDGIAYAIKQTWKEKPLTLADEIAELQSGGSEVLHVQEDGTIVWDEPKWLNSEG